jgi:hypothetical protein
MSVGALGYCLSIAILFLVTQKVQTKPAKRNMSTRIWRGPLPCSQTSENSCKEWGISPKLNTSFMNAQIILARTQSKKNMVYSFYNPTETAFSISSPPPSDQRLPNWQFVFKGLP